MKKLEHLVTVSTLVLVLYCAYMLAPKPDWAIFHKSVKITSLRHETFYGSANAPYTVVLFSDYECPYCKKAETGLVAEIKKLAVAGKVRYTFQDFPLPSHPKARKLAEAGRCAVALKEFWAVQPSLFAGEIPEHLQGCVDIRFGETSVDASIALGKSIGVKGTPTYVVGKTIPGGVDGRLYLGSFDMKIIQ